ncbi:proline--tRNA ligase [Dissulfurirhabdus thermomarina]|uniref:Proline--tRNA ligase n=1 Tax=Dissulfurirhabdus thermomarina TaxID=1765737 RepID=A0A6N9TLZ6_DISTH|nr:proline--tRNA ligase [Dissulfurirhabdus thermomarina]NDY41460.1 proline--tRNA ligase [Dissulfurirhabdus thermomarina]NMX24258.1 proline--tRNA ligase [Dissulfurirhabdus thermomarina]
MYYSRYFLPTLKETPADAETASHRLMLRAGMIRKLASGIYTYLPLGLRALRKVENIVREEMNRAGAQEVLLPMVQPAELWQETGRWDRYGKELLRIEDRHGRAACLGPTHEEVITDLVRKEVRSYRDLPLNLYQIATKFRDEIRPRFGLMRGREFIMKDAYSFDADEEGLDRTYQAMYAAYNRIFERCGLDFRPVEADTGTIGGDTSHEFMVLAETGEDVVAACTACPFGANVELAPSSPTPSDPTAGEAEETPRRVETPGRRTVEEVTAFLEVPASRLVKTLLLVADGRPVAALVRGDHELNEVKLQRHLGADTLAMADEATVRRLTGAPVGFAGPVRLDPSVRVVADHGLESLRNFVCGAGEADAHLVGVNWGAHGCPRPEFADIRLVTESDPCPRCGGRLELKRGIEVGHIFKLGTKYSEAMGATFLDPDGKERPLVMGCYGIGVGRTVAAAIEQNHDADGIVFPVPLAPFQVIVSVMNVRDGALRAAGEEIYRALRERGAEALLDDRDERAGVKFKDADLLGIPIRITVGRKLAETGSVEVTRRATRETEDVPAAQAAQRALAMLA